MFKESELSSLLVVDIETTTQYKDIEEFSINDPNLYAGFLKKAEYYAKTEYPDVEFDVNLFQKIYEQKAPLMPEFSKILGISLGGFVNEEIKTISFFDNSEEKVLNSFYEFLNKKITRTPNLIFTGYNIMFFDIRMIIKRSIILGIKIPNILKIYDKKPWDLTARFKDIFLLWQMGGKDFVSLDVVASCLGIQTHKSDMDGSKVYSVYYNEDNGLEKIKNYCEKDVILTGNVILKLIE